MDSQSLAWLAVPLLVWIALVHAVMASGVRKGELVWTGRYPRLLPRELRWRSIFYAVALVISAWIIAELAGLTPFEVVPERWRTSAGFVVTVFLGIAGLFSLFKGSRWERWLFAPITLFAAGLAGWMTFG